MKFNLFQARTLKARIIFFSLAIFLFGFWSLAFYASTMLQNDMQRLLGEQQFSAVSILAEHLNQEIEERLRALEDAAGGIGSSNPENAAAIQTYLEHLTLLQRQFNGGVFTTGIDGTATASVPHSIGRVGVNFLDRDHVAAALKEGVSKVSQPVIGKLLKSPVVSMATPIRDAHGTVIGSLVGVIDLGKPNFLDKITDSHYGNTGGYLVVAPQLRVVVTATDKSRIMQPLPAAGINPYIDKNIAGYEGYTVLVNPFGIEQLASIKKIPLAGWYLAAALPTEEAFYPIRTLQKRMGMVTVFFTLLVGGLIWWTMKRQLSPTIAAMKTLAQLSYTSGVPQTLPNTSRGEIGELIDGFNNILQKLALREEERRQAEQQLRIAATAFESQQGMLVTDANQIILRVNQAFTKITGYSEEEIMGQTPKILSSGIQEKEFYTAMWESINHVGAWEGEIWNRRKNGEVYPEHLTITAVRDINNTITHYVASLMDITLSKAASDEIKSLAFYDPLTSLPNRRLLVDRLNQALVFSARSGNNAALLFLDLDHFKTLNDTLGHAIGDLLLQKVAHRLTACVREGDTVARLSGDEFVVLLEGLSEHSLEAATQVDAIGHKILAALNQTYQLDIHEYHNTASIGVALFNEHQLGIEGLLKQADIAMYNAKAAGRNTLCFFEPQMQETITSRALMESELRTAIDIWQFQLYYQVQVDNLGRSLGAEALIRWLHPEHGLVSPFKFIPLAEETGLILHIGRWVLETACMQLKYWQQDELTRYLSLSVNVSAKQFRQPDFVAQVLLTVQTHSINPTLLKLELTESILLEDIDAIIVTMNALNEIGIRISLDDFGTGYSSLQYLKQLPIYQLKIDQSFVRDIPSDPNDALMVQTIINMAQNFSLNVIAEGVETIEQLAFLKEHGCMAYQGYLFSKPLPIEQFNALLRRG